jgi:hypothetical protein
MDFLSNARLIVPDAPTAGAISTIQQKSAPLSLISQATAPVLKASAEPRNAGGATYSELRALYDQSSYPADRRDGSARGGFDDGRTVQTIAAWLASEYPLKPTTATKPVLPPVPIVEPASPSAGLLRSAPILQVAAPSGPKTVKPDEPSPASTIAKAPVPAPKAPPSASVPSTGIAGTKPLSTTTIAVTPAPPKAAPPLIQSNSVTTVNIAARPAVPAAPAAVGKIPPAIVPPAPLAPPKALVGRAAPESETVIPWWALAAAAVGLFVL